MTNNQIQVDTPLGPGVVGNSKFLEIHTCIITHIIPGSPLRLAPGAEIPAISLLSRAMQVIHTCRNGPKELSGM